MANQTSPKKSAAKKAAKPVAKKPTAKKAPAKSAKKTTVKKIAAKKAVELTGEQLVVENLGSLSSLVRTISETLDVLVQKTENMAYHIIATEEVLAEVVAATGVDIPSINRRIRNKIALGTDKKGDPNRAIDIAAAIASPPKNSIS